VVNVITKGGSNQPHGTAFWVHNDNHLNSRSNLEKQVLAASPYRIENEFGGTFGGPLVKDKTFFFGSLERWTDRRLGAGNTIRGVPTEQGRALLDSLAGSRASVRMLLDNLPPAQAALPGLTAQVAVAGQTAAIPLGALTGASTIVFNAWQSSGRVDHRLSERHTMGGRYLFDDSYNYGDGQVTCRWRIPEIMPQWVSGRGRDSGAAICTKKNPMASVPLRRLASVLPSLNAPVDD
jgi:hypothetical protein